MQPLPLLRHGPAQAPPVLFLHGFMGAAADWPPVWKHLQGDWRCLAPDLPGHGTAPDRPSPDYTMEGCTDLLAATLRAEDVSECTVAGYSMGGRLALHFALAHPERCRRLFLESASPGLRTDGERTARRRLDAERDRRIRDDLPAFLEDWYRMPLFASLARHDLTRPMIRRRCANDPVALGRSLAGMGTGAQASLWDRLPDLAMPALVLAGALDEKYVRLTREMAECSGGRLRRAVVAGAGHTVHAERPARFARRLEAFLREAGR